MVLKKLSKSIRLIGLITFLSSQGVFSEEIFAQVIPDSSLGSENSILNGDVIEGGLKKGNNLFHSFTGFSIREGKVINFANPRGVTRIFSRVTGDNPSKIDGALGVLGDADLFLINPKGIIFGPNASLHLGGSFIGTTAESVVFSDGTVFGSQASLSSPLLTVSVPVGLQFVNGAGSITNQSVYRRALPPNLAEIAGIPDTLVGLEVQPNKTLTLVGGDIFLEGGSLTAFDGSIELISLGSNSQVQLQPSDKGWAIGTVGVQNFQDIKISGITNQPSYIASSIFLEPDTGEIHLQGRDISLIKGSQIQAVGGISIDAQGSFTVSGTLEAVFQGNVFTSTSALIAEAVSEQTGGKIAINTKRLILEQGGQISTGVSGIFYYLKFKPATGVGGDVVINASESVNISGDFSIINSRTIGIGNAGDILINAPRINLSDGGKITAFTESQGNAGNIQLRGVNRLNIMGTDTGIFVSRIQGQTPSLGSAGSIDIHANSISLDEQGRINADSELIKGGDIRLNISDLLTLRGGSEISTNSGRDGGNIDIKARFILATPSENSDITANAVSGTGGRIDIKAQGIVGIEPRQERTPLSDITASSESGLAGIINVNNSEIEPKQTPQKLEDQPIIDVAQLIDQSLCSVGKTNELTISGRGGFPNPLQQALREDNLWEDWRVAEGSSPNNPPTPKNRALPKTEVIPREFQGWTVNAAGNIVLTAQANIVTPQGNWLPPLGCQQ